VDAGALVDGYRQPGQPLHVHYTLSQAARWHEPADALEHGAALVLQVLIARSTDAPPN
jgi:hypothetical protein